MAAPTSPWPHRPAERGPTRRSFEPSAAPRVHQGIRPPARGLANPFLLVALAANPKGSGELHMWAWSAFPPQTISPANDSTCFAGLMEKGLGDHAAMEIPDVLPNNANRPEIGPMFRTKAN